MSLSIAEKEALTAARLEAVRKRIEDAPRGTKLAGKVCIITGTNSLRGIGYASVVAFAREGMNWELGFRASHLYLLDPFDNNSAEIRGSLEKAYPDVKVTIVKGDASDDKTLSSLCQKVLHEEGRLDVFYANGAICTWKPLADTSFEEFLNTIKINSGSAFLALKHGSRAMAVTSANKPDSGGSIILTASLAGMRGNTGSVDYSASKAAINSIAMTGAAQLAGQNIRVNSICPGMIDTNMVAGVFDAYEAEGKRNRLGWATPIQRHALPGEIAAAAVFLASGLGGSVPAVDEPLAKMAK
ncbi:hypothetical protein FS837_006913 [Tulasnella sp. UAMH 9824]|nr:hypothetical protein FS837_006913 [Tulasnella sp. UAMH 9824]